jgi:hypothetical protein
LDDRIGSAWLQAAWNLENHRWVDELAELLGGVDLTAVLDRNDPMALVDPMERTLSNAMGWQEPDGEDLIAARPAIIAALRPVADALLLAPGAAWWTAPVDRLALRYVSRFDRHDKKWLPADPIPGDTTERLVRWRKNEIQTTTRDRKARPDDPTAAYSGSWWSAPNHSRLISTTRPLSRLGAIELVWHEDSMGETDALLWPMVTTRPSRVYEVNGPEDWVNLVRQYPLDVTSSRRHDWYRVTGRDGRWLIPDYAAVATEWDAVHLSVAGYLTTATRHLPIDDRASTVLTGWDPDQTWWLTDVLQTAGPAQHWHRPKQHSPKQMAPPPIRKHLLRIPGTRRCCIRTVGSVDLTV